MAKKLNAEMKQINMPNPRANTETVTFGDRFRAFFGTLAAGGGMLQAMTRFVFVGYGGQSGTAGFFGSMFGGVFTFKGKEVDPLTSAPVVATLNWICRTFVAAPIMVYRKDKDNKNEPLPNHPLLSVLRRPNEAYSWAQIFYAVIVSLYHDGNAYLIKRRSEKDQTVVALYYVPHWMIEPQWPADGSAFISHYVYAVNGKNLWLRPEDVIHFRKGNDPTNTRKGFGVLRAVIKEIFTDEAAAKFTAWMLDNYAIPGIIIAPDDDRTTIDDDDADDMKELFKKKFGGEKVGEPLFLTHKAKITQLGHNPKNLALKEIRRITEERVSAVTGVPAIVANLGAGLDSSTYNNLENLKRSATYETLVPLWIEIAEQLTNQLLVEFTTQKAEFIDFDTTQVKHLKEDAKQQADIAARLFQADIITRAVALRRIGEQVDEARDNVFYSDVRALRPTLPNASDGGSNGNGRKQLTGAEITGGAAFVPARLLTAGQETKSFFRELDGASYISEAELSDRLSMAFRNMADAAEAAASVNLDTNAPRAEARRIAADTLGDEGDITTPVAAISAALILMQRASVESVKKIVARALDAEVTAVWTAETQVTVDARFASRRAAYISDLREQTEDAIAQAIRDIKAGRSTEDITERIATMVSGRGMYPGKYDEAFQAAKAAGASDATAAAAGERAARLYRAGVIAETEVVTAQNIASIEAFETSGKVSKVRVSDGNACGWRSHNDPDKAHGTERSLDDSRRYALAHPHCRRRFEPILI